MNRMLVTQWKICSKMFFRTVSKGILWLVYKAAAHFRGISAMFFPAEICSSYVYTCHYCKLKRRLKPLESIPFLPYFALSFVHTIRKQVKALFLYKWCHSTRFSDPIFTHIRNEHFILTRPTPAAALISRNSSIPDSFLHYIRQCEFLCSIGNNIRPQFCLFGNPSITYLDSFPVIIILRGSVIKTGKLC